MSFRSQRSLEMVLARLAGFEQPSWEREQYATPAGLAAEWVWGMALRGEVAGQVFLDAGCGPGIVGLGLLLLGARKVFFLDADAEVIKTCWGNVEGARKSFELGEAEFLAEDVSLFDGEVDAVVQNPPFGTKQPHLDRRFLEKAFSLAPLVYSMHKYSTKWFVESFVQDHGFAITHAWRYDFPLKTAFPFHRKRVVTIDVGLWRMEKRE